MKHSHYSALVLLCAAATQSFAADNPASYKPPRTMDGKPDLQGVWTNVSLTSLQRSPQYKTNTVSEEDARRIEQRVAAASEKSLRPSDVNAPDPPAGSGVGGYNSFYGDAGVRLSKVKGQYRTTWLTNSEDGQLPYSATGKREFDKELEFVRNNYDGPEGRPMAERCIVGFGSTGGPPMINVMYNNNYQIVQTADHVVILVEMNHDARIIRLNGKHNDKRIHPYLGDSVGHWEGDTLVVETTHFNPGDRLRTYFAQSFLISEDATVTERFTRVSPTEILYAFSVNDPKTYSKVWTAEMAMTASSGNVYEYACHEGNYALPGILAGARKEEAEKAAKK
jgi:hypothetical protein